MENTNKNISSHRKLKYGTLSAVTTFFVIAIFIVINLIAQKFNLSWDLTPDRFYSISQESKQILNEIEQEVTIYTLFKTGEEIPMYSQMLEEYKKFPNIKVENKDPYLNSTFLRQFSKVGEAIPVNSVIVSSGKRNKVIKANELFTTSFDPYTLAETVDTIVFEPKVTSAVKYVTADKTYTVYKVSGHEEQDFSEGFKDIIQSANFEIKDLNIMTAGLIPEDCSVLFITTPQTDWSKAEADILKSYLENGGKAIFFIDYTNIKLENLNGVLGSYGAAFLENVVLESDSNYIVPMKGNYNPFYLIPVYTDHAINNSVRTLQSPCLMPETRPIYLTEVKRNSIIVESVLKSSSSSYMKNLQKGNTSLNFEEGDVKGPFDLVFAVSENFSGAASNETTRIIIAGSTALINEDYSYGANKTFVISLLNWLQGEKDNTYIPAKSVSNTSLQFNTQKEILTILAVSFVVLPAVIIIFGITAYFRRRNK